MVNTVRFVFKIFQLLNFKNATNVDPVKDTYANLVVAKNLLLLIMKLIQYMNKILIKNYHKFTKKENIELVANV